MANALYPKFKEKALQGLDLSAVNVKALLVDLDDYTYSAAHEFLSDVPSGARIAASSNLTSKTFTGGVFDSADPSVTGVSGDEFEGLILYVATGDPATSRLIAFFDTGGDLVQTPDGGNFNIQVDPSGWFSI